MKTEECIHLPLRSKTTSSVDFSNGKSYNKMPKLLKLFACYCVTVNLINSTRV